MKSKTETVAVSHNDLKASVQHWQKETVGFTLSTTHATGKKEQLIEERGLSSLADPGHAVLTTEMAMGWSAYIIDDHWLDYIFRGLPGMQITMKVYRLKPGVVWFLFLFCV